MDKCQCGAELKAPGMWVGYNQHHVPVAILHCQSCGAIIPMQINALKPYVADLATTFPPPRGEYQIAPDKTVNFTCPVCKGTHGLGAPIHNIDAAGKVTPSVVCPYSCGFHVWMTLKDW